uniref:Uncharacterized protein n=1 Tax=Trichobilharzia regenti TaxID=157069 RepID=A0AA85J5Y2_TRIRE
MKSSDESEFSKDGDSSEEGEVQSEIDEVEVTLDTVVKKDETPWERGLRLARERLERVKALKAKEKNLAEKRMNLPVPATFTEKKSDASLEDDYLWPCYYQAYIIGRTELTGHRYLPEDLITPSAAETAEWRRRVTKHHRGRGNQRRRSGSQNYSSRSSSSSVSSSSRSSSRSSNASSNISSLASVALSWKETCAKAMKPFLRSPKRRRRYDSQHSSDSNSRSSDSDSGSARSHSAYHTAASGARYGAGAGGGGGGRNRNYWGAGKHRGRNIESGRSSASRSDSNSSVGFRGRTGGRFGRQTNLRAGRKSKSPGSPPRRRTDIPPLPSERPVKRPWVAAPSLAAVQNLSKGDGREKLHSRSSSGSRSPFGKDIESKQFITSWSRSPSSGGEGRREVLPDVVPGPRIRGKRIASPLRRKKSRSPFADDAIGLSAVTNTANANTITNTTNNNWPPVSNDRNLHTVEHIEPELYPKTATTINTGTNEITSSIQPTGGGGAGAGELPTNRPGVRLTLAPRIKPAPVGISSLASAAPNRSTTNRPPPQQPASPPRQVRHLGVPVLHRHTSPIDPNHPSTVGTTNNITMPLTQTQVRLQAEAAAAALEVRERRRAAAEAAVNKRQRSRRHKRTDLKNIPLLGRPTYRRQSFSASSGASGSSNLSHSSRSPSGGRSHSESGKPIGVRHSSPPMGRHIPSRQDQEVRSNVARKRTRQEAAAAAAQRQSLKEIDENSTRRHVGRSAGAVVNSIDSREPIDYGRHAKQSDFNERTAHRMRGIDQFGHDTTQSLKRPYPSGYDELPVRERLERDPRISSTRYPNAFIDEPHSRNINAETRRVGAGQIKERIVRPRTPHGLDMIDFNRRSPHGDIDILPKILRLDREQYRRVNYDIPDISTI